MPPLPLVGGCQCGQLRYEVRSAPITLYCCHCTECQTQASSAFGMSMRVDAGAVKTFGREGIFLRDGGKQSAVECVFCPDCGSRLVHRGRGGDWGSSVKAGTLDDRSWLRPVGHIWAHSAQPWMALDGLVYDKQPDDGFASLIAAFKRQYHL